MAHTSLSFRVVPLTLLLFAFGALLFVLSPASHVGVSSSSHVVHAAPHAHGGLKKRYFFPWGFGEKEIVKKAVVYIRPDPASTLPINGTITFTQEYPEGPTKIVGTITGLDPSAERGLHIHAYGVNLPSCTAAGPHFNPFNVSHGAPTNDAKHRHVGDLGNVKSDDQGTVTLRITDKLISLNGKRSVIGRAIVLHAGTDDLGLGGDDESTRTGNAGARSGCGIIGISAPA